MFTDVRYYSQAKSRRTQLVAFSSSIHAYFRMSLKLTQHLRHVRNSSRASPMLVRVTVAQLRSASRGASVHAAAALPSHRW